MLITKITCKLNGRPLMINIILNKNKRFGWNKLVYEWYRIA
jgi:hypothetical protein